MARFNHWLVKRFLPRAISRVCAETLVPRSDSRADTVNCFYVYTVSPEGRPRHSLRRIEGNVVKANEFDGRRFSDEEVSLALETIEPESLRLAHYYGRDTVEYEGISSYALARITRLPYLRIHWFRFTNANAQKRFNRSTFETGSREALLRDVLHATSRERSDAVDALDLMSYRHGDRWAGHPGWAQHQRDITRRLEMLADTGDLTKVGHSFQANGNTLKALDANEREDARHADTMGVQLKAISTARLVGWLGAIAAIFAALLTAVLAGWWSVS